MSVRPSASTIALHAEAAGASAMTANQANHGHGGTTPAHSPVVTAVSVWPAVVGWVVGMWLALGPTWTSAFSRIQGDLSDARLNNYILEHGYRWMLGMPGHRALWSPPIFFPTPNTGAYSDILLGVGPLYWPWRALGFAPDTSFQMWMLSVASLNYVLALACCRRVLRVDWPAAALGAFVFAFGSIRIAQLSHAQLFGQFYWVIALYAIARLVERRSGSSDRSVPTARDWLWTGVVAACVVLQVYAGYYQGWFLAFVFVLGGFWALALPATRPALARAGRRVWKPAGVFLCLSALALLPLLQPYMHAAQTVGLRPYSMVTAYLPRVWSWLFVGSNSVLYGWLARYSVFSAIPESTEHHLGLGLVTTAVACGGLWSTRRQPLTQLMIACAAAIVALSTYWPDGASAWVVIYRVVPGAAAVRGVSRIALALLVPAGVGAALWAQRWQRWPLAVGAAALLMAAEQWQGLPSYDKPAARERVSAVARAIPRGCGAFLYVPRDGQGDPWLYQTDAMWASIATGVPTVNGYSGNVPPGWTFYRNMEGPESSDSAVTQALRAWASTWLIEPSRLCRVPASAPVSSDQVERTHVRP
jgi:hypothetical protein